MKIAILGAGALGSVIGAYLARAGKPVSLWDVNEKHVSAVRENGLLFESPDGREVVHIPAMHPVEAKDPVDLVILLTKTIHTQGALESISQHIRAGAHVLTLQNGLGNAARVAEQVPADQVLYGCTMMNGRFHGPGHVSTQGQGNAVFRPLTEAGRAFAERAEVTVKGISLRISDKTDSIIWQKAAFNCAMNAVTGLTGSTVGGLTALQNTTDLLHSISTEVTAIARAQGITVDGADVRDQIAHALTHHQEHKPSMLQDIEAGRPTEIDSLCGEVVRQAKAHSMDAPLNAAFDALIRLKTMTMPGPLPAHRPAGELYPILGDTV